MQTHTVVVGPWQRQLWDHHKVATGPKSKKKKELILQV